ncbi:MAG: TlpA family protein disulfide reductase [Anaerolineales bacterium]|nr:TlpA family protein disulfide reductase [Anaerolineales bacterium]
MQPVQRRFLLTLLLLAGLVWIFLSRTELPATPSGLVPAPQAGFLAPDFRLETLDGGQVRLSDLRGQVVVVNFWATWCPPCRAEMPALQAVHEAYDGRGVIILGVNATSQDSLDAVHEFVTDHELSFLVALDLDNGANRLYEIRSLPTTFFVRPDGGIAEVVIGGPMAEAALRARIEDLLQEAP